MTSDNRHAPPNPLPRTISDVPLADLSHLYNKADPRAYYAALNALDYQTPRHVQRLARWCCQQRQAQFDNESMWVIDIGCGYAINAAGLRHGTEPLDLYARYCEPDITALETHDLRHTDRTHFSDAEDGNLHVAGIDTAEHALMYGMETGLLSAGFSEDLTCSAPSLDLLEIINQSAVIMESGVPIFVLPYILDSVLSASAGENRPWVVTAPPRYTDLTIYHDILGKHGYVLQQAYPDSLPHRRFLSENEKRDVIADQATMGLDNHLEEAEGYIRVELYLARPEDESRSGISFDPLL